MTITQEKICFDIRSKKIKRTGTINLLILKMYRPDKVLFMEHGVYASIIAQLQSLTRTSSIMVK